MIWACFYGRLDIVEAILGATNLKDKVDVNLKDNSGRTALIWASFEGCLDIFEAILGATNLKDMGCC